MPQKKNLPEIKARDLDRFLAQTNYTDDTKNAIRRVIIHGDTYQEAANSMGVSRQRIFNRVRDCCSRMGLQ